MKIILFMAMSVNGIIARKNNEEDFLSNQGWNNLVELTNKTSCLIWGRKTYEIVSQWDKKYLEVLDKITKIIISSDKKFQVKKGFISANSPQNALQKLQKLGFKEVVLTGGSTINTAFAKENLIDEIILNIEPVIIGEGVSLFNPNYFDLKLQFKEVKNLTDNVIQVHYKVIKSG